MQFSILKTAVAALAICSDVVLGQTAGQMIATDLKTLTDQSNDVLTTAKGITIVTFLVSGGPKVISQLRQVVATGTNALPQWAEVTDAAEALTVAGAYADFAKVHQAAMDELKSKAGLIQQIFGAPLASLLRVDENMVDSISFQLTDFVKSHADDIKKAHDPLAISIQECLRAYDSPAFGTVKRGSAAFRESLRV